MAYREVRGVRLRYEVIGEGGPWLALSPGGRRSMDEIAGLAAIMAGKGYRVLIHDRRNTGWSDISFAGQGSEFEIWADDLHALLLDLGAGEAILGGSSSGCRLSILFALRYPQMVRALLLMRVTGGAFAVRRLAKRYYTDYIEAARRGGMAAVAETEHFAELIARTQGNAGRLLALDPDAFIARMESWRASLEEGLHTPVLGAGAAELASLRAPTCILPGNDNTHSAATARLMQALVPGCELHELRPDHQDVDILSMGDWADDATIAAVLTDFLARRLPGDADNPGGSA